ncbi:MAG TPA: hypothetical protein VLS93_14355 [Anaeromyxobacteraceae bacterium]|nr:hypothetical protein [Anaeromyxobacteraceae bacterium]
MRRRFVESRGFSDDRRRLERAREFSDDDMVALEQRILADPEVGDLVPGTGGLRKARVAQSEARRGKRGGVRVYYLDLPRRGVTHLVAIFGKREKTDLSKAERQAVAGLVRRLKEEA